MTFTTGDEAGVERRDARGGDMAKDKKKDKKDKKSKKSKKK